MKDSNYLYGVSADTFMNKIYIEALHYKKEKAKLLLHELQEVPFYERDEKRINDVYKAIEFNRRLLNEVEE